MARLGTKRPIVRRDVAGRPPGAPNRATSSARLAIAAFVDGNADKLSQWLDEIYLRDGPKDAFNCFLAVVEFHIPKLARIEAVGEVKVNHVYDVDEAARRIAFAMNAVILNAGSGDAPMIELNAGSGDAPMIELNERSEGGEVLAPLPSPSPPA